MATHTRTPTVRRRSAAATRRRARPLRGLHGQCRAFFCGSALGSETPLSFDFAGLPQAACGKLA